MNYTTASILCYLLPVFMTTLGSFLVFFMKNTSKTVKTLTLGLSAGIMFSASIWSLLVPALEDSKATWGNLSLIPVTAGFAIGIVFMAILELITSCFFKKNKEKGKTFRFFTAITVHNIPEGLSIGFALGSVSILGHSPITAFLFALGIALQNLPEGLATALPIYSTTNSKKIAFTLATLSGIVEPICTLIGFYLATALTTLLPWLLTFSAGTMIFVIIQELTPEIHKENHCLGTLSFAFGFLAMMILDLAF